MIEKLLDDFYHVEQACSILSGKPFDRPLVNALHCLGGESVMASRWIGLITMIAAMFVFIRFLHSGEKRRPLHLFALFHPIILFPFLYASQLSSAVTVAWAVGGTVFFFQKYSNMAWAISGALLLAIVGLGVRFEAPYILIMMVGSMLILFQSRDNLTIAETVRRYFYRDNIVKIGTFLGSFFAIKKLANAYFLKIDGVLRTVTLEQGMHYPLESWYNSQVVAVLHYLQNFLFPFSPLFLRQLAGIRLGSADVWQRPSHGSLFIFGIGFVGVELRELATFPQYTLIGTRLGYVCSDRLSGFLCPSHRVVLSEPGTLGGGGFDGIRVCIR